GFEKPQQLRLQVESQLADFVEEQRAVFRGSDQALVVALGSRERTTSVTEQLAFEELARDSRAVERHEWLFGAGRETVNGARQNFLAGPTFAGDEDGDIGARDFSCK